MPAGTLVTTPVPVPTTTTCSLKLSGDGDGEGDVDGDGEGPGGGVGSSPTVIGREQAAVWSPLITRTVELNTPSVRNVCAGFGLVEVSPSPNVHRNS